MLRSALQKQEKSVDNSPLAVLFGLLCVAVCFRAMTAAIRTVHALRALLLLPLALSASAGAQMRQAIAHEPAAVLPPCVAGAYTGQTSAADGRIDLNWYRRVRAQADEGERCVRYLMRAAPRLGAFDSIHPVPLGGGAQGFEARRGSERHLLTPQGQDLLGAPYSQPLALVWPIPATAAAPQSAASASPSSAHTLPPLLPATFTLAVRDDARGLAYLRMQNGRLLSRSPWFADPPESELTARHPVPPASGLRPFLLAEPPGQVGLIDLRTLKQTLPPRYAAIGALPPDAATPKTGEVAAAAKAGEAASAVWLLFGQRPEGDDAASATLDFFWPDGRPIAHLPAAQDLRDSLTPEGQRRYIILHERRAAICHYYSPALQTLLPGGVPLPAASARCPALREGQPLRFTDAGGHTRRYSYTLAHGLRALGEPLPGQLVAQSANHFMLELPPPADVSADPVAPRYMAYDDGGHPLPDAVGFENFEDQGCGLWRVQRDGQWRTFTEDGLLPERQPPEGCADQASSLPAN